MKTGPIDPVSRSKRCGPRVARPRPPARRAPVPALPPAFGDAPLPFQFWPNRLLSLGEEQPLAVASTSGTNSVEAFIIRTREPNVVSAGRRRLSSGPLSERGCRYSGLYQIQSISILAGKSLAR